MREISHITLKNQGDFIVRPGFVYVDGKGSRICEKGHMMVAAGSSATISLKDHGIPEAPVSPSTRKFPRDRTGRLIRFLCTRRIAGTQPITS